MAKFEGLPRPSSNYFKVPNEFLRMVPHLSGGALRIALYIIRHTWGFSEYSKPKKITIDEFVNGRKRKDGTRMDSGAGVSARGISEWLNELEEIGLIRVEVDDSDKARVKKWYQIIISDEVEEDQCTNVDMQEMHIDMQETHIDMQETHIDMQETHIYPARNAHRTEKDTEGRNNKKDTVSPPGRNGDISRGSRGFPLLNDDFNLKKDEADFLADELYSGLVEKNKITAKPRLSNWAHEIRKFLNLPGRTVQQFEKVMIEYLSRINDEYMPQAFCAASFCRKFPNIEAALRRKKTDSSDEQVRRVLSILEKEEKDDK